MFTTHTGHCGQERVNELYCKASMGREDHESFILDEWTLIGNLASRRWPVFRSYFNGAPRLRSHDVPGPMRPSMNLMNDATMVIVILFNGLALVATVLPVFVWRSNWFMVLFNDLEDSIGLCELSRFDLTIRDHYVMSTAFVSCVVVIYVFVCTFFC